jgi:integrase
VNVQHATATTMEVKADEFVDEKMKRDANAGLTARPESSHRSKNRGQPRRIRLTQLAVDRLGPPAQGRIVYWDTDCPCFGIRISASRSGGGFRKSYVVMYRVRRRLKMETLGPAHLITKVGEARERARQRILKAREGKDPAADEIRTKMLFGIVAEKFIAHLENNLKRRQSTIHAYNSILNPHVKPRWSNIPIREITDEDVADLLGGIARAGTQVTANRTLTLLKSLFRWAMVPPQKFIEKNPAEGLRKVGKEKPRQRYLSEDEIGLFLVACELIGWPYGPLFQLLLLTGQREGEVAGMTRTELDLENRLWTIPGERTKNHLNHLVHLSDMAVSIIKGLPSIANSEFLFSMSGKRPVSNFSDEKSRVHKIMLALLRKRFEAADADPASASVRPWVIHDLRRTASTGMRKLRVDKATVERVLNHISGQYNGVAGVYDIYEAFPERREALDKWAAEIERMARNIELPPGAISGPGSVEAILPRRRKDRKPAEPVRQPRRRGRPPKVRVPIVEVAEQPDPVQPE